MVLTLLAPVDFQCNNVLTSSRRLGCFFRAPGQPFFATIRVHPKYGHHNCASARTDTPGIRTGKNIHNPTATKNYVSTKLPRLESATPTATRTCVFADEVPHQHAPLTSRQPRTTNDATLLRVRFCGVFATVLLLCVFVPPFVRPACKHARHNSQTHQKTDPASRGLALAYQTSAPTKLPHQNA